jgi:hypothetical protein
VDQKTVAIDTGLWHVDKASRRKLAIFICSEEARTKAGLSKAE